MVARPAATSTSSDESVSSIATFSSTSSISEELRYSSESLNHPYSNLSANIIRTSSVDGSEDNETDSPFKTRFDSLGEYAFPRTTGNRTLSEEKERFPGEMDKSLQSLTEGKEEHFLSNHGTAGRHNSLPLYNSSASIHPQHDSRSQSQSVLDPTLFTNPRVSPRPPTSPPISIARSHSFGNPASPSHSSLRSPSNPPHFLGSSRPHSSGTFSTASSNASTNTRPWVRDSDASSICSTGSGSYWSDQTTDAEVLKVGADGIEFLDPRPEPPGARLSINREDALQVVIKVTLPGFSLDNITVAMRRGHKVHIVADSYGENGGHFEKLISLGADVISAAPRAEFNGTELSVFVQRRQPSTSVPPTSLSVASPSISSPSSSTQSLSPNSPSTSSNTSEEAPIATRSTATGKHKVLTGPEGAKAAAKLARDEATSRAKEAAKDLPKFRKQPFASERERSRSRDDVSQSSIDVSKIGQPTLSIKIPASGETTEGTPTISPSFSVFSNTSATTATADNSSLSSNPRNSTSSQHSSSKSLSAVALSPRPKLRTSNLTLRPSTSTFFEASLSAREEEWTNSARSEGTVTPRVELDQMGFEPFTVDALLPPEEDTKEKQFGTAL